MEPAQVEVIVHTSTVTNVEPRGPENWVFSMDNMYGLWLALPLPRRPSPHHHHQGAER
jgi:hypothetical protein